MASSPDNLGTEDVNGPPSSAGAAIASGPGTMPYTPALVVTEVENAPGDTFAAQVTMPDKSKVVVYLRRSAVANQNVEFSLRAAAAIWGAYPGHQTRGS